MKWNYNTSHPGIDDLIKGAKKRVPKFAFEYLDGGCNEEIRDVELKPLYLKDYKGANLKTTLFGHEYDAPFGVAPVGLQGLMWPNAPQILAKAAKEHNVPFILSTVTTASIEEISEITEGKAWFQLYHPAENELRDKIIKRAEAAQCPVLVILCDVPTFGFRPRDIRNGLAMPPRMTLRNIYEIMTHPNWALRTLINGQPAFETLKPYIPKGLDMKQLGLFMNQTFNGRLFEEKIKPIRDMWKGKLVLKGVASIEDAAMAARLGLDGIIVSNHGGRQLDAGQSTIKPLQHIANTFKNKLTIMMDSGIRSGVDVARTMAMGADFTFMGRTFMYSVGALGNEGGTHAMGILKTGLKQVMEQVGCENVKDFPAHLVS
jgi:L-lactate dehydrogenase (cytochrome)